MQSRLHEQSRAINRKEKVLKLNLKEKIGLAIWLSALILAAFAGVLPTAVHVSPASPIAWGLGAVVLAALSGGLSLACTAMILEAIKVWPLNAFTNSAIIATQAGVILVVLAMLPVCTPTALVVAVLLSAVAGVFIGNSVHARGAVGSH
jgi:hypothetical protein